jgi:hypothetical protein
LENLLFQTIFQAVVCASGTFLIHQKGKPFLKRDVGVLRIGLLLAQTFAESSFASSVVWQASSRFTSPQSGNGFSA